MKQHTTKTTKAPPQYQLRVYQHDLIQSVFEYWASQRRLMLQLPTGGGKTIIFAAIVLEFVRRNLRVLILAHRQELIEQAASKMRAIVGCEVGIIKASCEPNLEAPIQVASVQSLINRLHWLDHIDLVVIDEAHHATAKSYPKILAHFPEAYQLGVTATPIRLDGTGFRDLFDSLICGPTVSQLIDAGYLSRFKLYADPNPMSTKGVKIRSGDFSSGDLAKANPVVELAGNLVSAYRQRAMGKRCVVFCVNVEHSRGIADRYNAAGIPAVHLDGSTPADERKEALARFAAGEIQVLTNCALFDEGLDIPALEAVQIAKPTKSLSRWLQMVGRALRPAEGKDHALILDHTKNWAIHGLPTRRRIWTLDGVEEQDSRQTQAREDGEVVEAEEIIIAESEIELQEISEPDPVDEWQLVYRELIALQQSRGYKKGWCFFKLQELQPPLEIWQAYGEYCGYKSGWAYFQFQNQQGQEAA